MRDVCCPDHSTFGTFSCDTTRHAACCDLCPDWFPACFWCFKVHPDGGYKRCFECQHVFTSKRELRRGHRKFFRQEMRDRSLPVIFSSRFGPSRLRALWKFLTLRANEFGFCPMCTHDF